MEKHRPVGTLTLQHPLRSALPPRDPFRVSGRPAAAAAAAGWERAHAGCARRRPSPPLPPGGAGEPAFLRLRNERERQRVRCVNEGYARLRAHLPRELAARRLSKVQTLRAAAGYIRQLQELLERQARRPEPAAGPAPARGPDCGSDGESKASSAASPCSEPEDRGGG